ncbi:uncharacterized protein LY79DRAFT_542339 [Colletotrichum navitas]|uniref:Uncharacterized protein n=1 Tax=Colletotrichum navitas TaxID=681940 RepID=A0AAD8Q747_9PEZI|nr:uncharacterized protein LY79DRAFT_542339 [Colletotrichum navitas]KAK1597158.1 hypothetical protein LY79DRAFT_542339 [Colletotrichum navitas]
MQLSIYMVSAVLAAVATAKQCTTSFGTGECSGAGSICLATKPQFSESCPNDIGCTTSSGSGECGAGKICLVTKAMPSNDCP